MKLLKSIFIAICAVLTVTSCEMRNEIWSNDRNKEAMGGLDLNVAVKQPSSMTRASEPVVVTNYPVTIQGITDKNFVREFDAVSDIPAGYLLPVGDYKISAHTPGELQKQMSTPYYGGEKIITISKDETDQHEILCKMLNSRVQMVYGDDFKENFESWTITVEDGTNSVISYTQADLNPAPVFFAFDQEKKVTKFQVNITAVTKKGIEVSASSSFTKKDANPSEEYEDVSDNFVGGDALNIHMGAVSSGIGQVTGITINTKIIFENYEEEVTIPGNEEVVAPSEPTEPTPGEPGEDDDTPSESAVTLNLPADVTFGTEDLEYPEAKALISSEAGLSQIIVTIKSGNKLFTELLEQMNTGAGLDFVNAGVNIIDNDLFAKQILASVNVDGPKTGDKTFNFPIDAFFGPLTTAGATDAGKAHEFHITVIDLAGDRATGVFKATLTE